MTAKSDAELIDEFVPFWRVHPLSPEEDAKQTVEVIDRRVAWLAEHGLRAHPRVLANRLHCIDFLSGWVARFELERFRRGGVF
jgi:hypothetical protein